jgi:hypothetical protein
MPAVATLKPAAARIDQVLNAFGMWVAMAITNDNITSFVDVVIGSPDPDDVEARMDAGEALVYLQVQPGGGDDAQHARLNRYRTIYPVVNLYAQVERGVVTFSGTVSAGLNIFVIGGWPTKTVYYQTTGLESSLTALAGAVASGTTSAGLSSTQDGPTLSYAVPVKCNIGGTGSIVRESSRKRERILAVVLARSADDEVNPLLGLRSAIGHAIISQIGSQVTDNLALDDGTLEIIRNRSNWFVDRSESAYGIAEYHLLYEVNYGILEITPATQIGAISNDLTNDQDVIIDTTVTG